MKLRLTVYIIILGFISRESVFGQTKDASFTRNGRNIEFSVKPPEKTKKIIVEYHSNRNRAISKLTDVSPQNQSGINPGMVEGKDMWFPVVDVELTNSSVAVAVFENYQQGDRYCWNGNFWNDCGKLTKKIVFKEHIEHWENHLFVESESAQISQFYVQHSISVIKEPLDRVPFKVRTLSDDWSGTVILKYIDEIEGVISQQTLRIEPPISIIKQRDQIEISRAGLIESLKETVSYILRSQNKNPLSPTYGGLYLFYDLDADTYRRSDWIWGYGPSIKLLLEAAKVQEVAEHFGYEKLIEVAKLIGEASLKFQIKDSEHPAYGLVICRYDPKLYYERGFTGFASPADAHFLAGWGWIPLYEATGDRRFLEAAELQTEQIGRILTYDSVIEQDYILRINKWKNWTMDESGFGMEGFAEVYKHSPNEEYPKIAKEYIDGLINVLEAPNGLWYKNYHRNQPERADDGWPAYMPSGTSVVMKQGQTSRGNGWAMIGLLASHRIMPEGDVYLTKASILADNIAQEQLPNGAFPFKLYETRRDVSISDKGTPLWSMLFYRLYSYTEDIRHLEAAQRALLWSMDSQYKGDKINAYGGIVGDTWAAGIVYRNFFPLTCTYGIAWHGLAVLEQLKLSEK